MAKLRISLSALRRLVRGMLPMLEADDPDLTPARKAFHDLMSKYGNFGSVVPPSEYDEFEKLLARATDIDPAEKAAMAAKFKGSQKPAGGEPFQSQGGHDVKTGGRAVKGGSGAQTVTKGYKGHDIQMPYKMPLSGMEKEIPPEVFQKILQVPPKQRSKSMQIAADAFRNLPAHHGSLHQRAGMFVYVPDEPHMKTMFYTGVPPKLNKDGSVREPAKPMAWRLADEMTQDQRQRLGFIDARDMGKVKRPEELRDTPMPGPTPPQAKPKGRSMWDPTGGLDIGGWSEMGGAGVPSATSELPGHGGGIPTHAAKQAAERGASAASTTLNPKELSLAQLRQAYQAASNRWKDSHEAKDKRVMQSVEDAIRERLKGVPPQGGAKK